MSETGWALLCYAAAEIAGRAYAAYGGIYIIASLVWLCAVEGVAPSTWDIAGAIMCLAGAGVILIANVKLA